MLRRTLLQPARLLTSHSFFLSSRTAAISIPRRPFSSRSDSPASKPQDSGNTNTSTKSSKMQGLPAPGEGEPITLDVSVEGGSTVKLSSIGPLVVNVDGTVARISNWGEMTEPERETTLRLVGKRNKQRLAALKAKKDAAEGGKDAASSETTQ